ncbi:MAG: hypothetical protein ACK4UO_08415 [Pseudolabrys sp.]
MLTANWNGSPVVIDQYQSVAMSQTPNGSLVVAFLNRSRFNNAGQLTFTSGGGSPQNVPVPALVAALGILVNNWASNNLNINNTSAAANTPIFVEAFGPGIPGAQPSPLATGVPVQLATGQAAQGSPPPNWMRLRLTSNTANYQVLAIVAGPAGTGGNNAYVVALNASAETGPPPLPPPPDGFYATTTANSYDFVFYSGSVAVYVANLSSQTSLPVTLLLQSL